MESIEKALSPGVMLEDRYRIERVLGEGGFGITYLARDTTLDCRVAIKEFLPVELAARLNDSVTVQARTNRTEDYRFGIERFLEEARTLAKFRHPNIVSVSNYLEANGTAYIVMAFEEGVPLSEWLKNHKTLDEDLILKIITPILEGLAEVHKTGLLHRDIKPGNIFMRKQGGPMLIDFGSARHALGEHSKSLSAIISQGYAPPEQYTTRGKQGPYTDLYAVGAVLYELITGKTPIESVDRAHELMGGEPDPLVPALEAGQDKASDWLLQLTDQLLAITPKDRPQSASDVLAAITNQVVPAAGAAPAANTPAPENKTRVVSNDERFNPTQPATKPARAAEPEKTGSRGLVVFVVIVLAVIAGGGWWYSQQTTLSPVDGMKSPETVETREPEVAVPPKGRAILILDTVPTGAEAYLDDVPIGRTPINSDTMPGGMHQLRLVHPNTMDETITVPLADNEVLKRTVQLKSAMGNVTVFSEPAGARISIDGEDTGKRTPATIRELKAGEHELMLSKDAFYPKTVALNILKGRTIREDRTLEGGHLVQYKGEWVEPEEKARRIEEEEQARRLAEARARAKQAADYRRKAKARADDGDVTGTQGLLSKAAKLIPDTAGDKAILARAKKKQQQQQRTERLAGRLVTIPAGRFRMGSKDGDSDEQPVHTANIGAFRLGETEVTQKQWRAVMGNNPSRFSGCDDCPVEKVSWEDIQDYLKKLNQQTGQRFRLPSEAEWEYACRSRGKEEKYCGGDNVDAVAWHGGNSGSKTHPVKQKQPNGLGLYDMSGNVWEWVQDCWNDSYRGAPADGRAWTSGNCERRSVRGGGWYTDPAWVRSATRTRAGTAYRHGNNGFRLAQDL